MIFLRRHVGKLAAILALAAAVSAISWRHQQRQRTLDLDLIRAAFRANVSRVDYLIESGANPKSRYGSSGREDFKYADGGYEMTANRWTALIALANSEAAGAPTAIAQRLLDAGAEIDADDDYGTTALAECCYRNRELLALHLLERGANPNTRTGVYLDGTGGIAPIHHATQNSKVLRSLIAHGARVNVLDDSGDSPLHWALRDRNPEVVQTLIDAGADVNAARKDGKTPLQEFSAGMEDSESDRRIYRALEKAGAR